MGRAYGTGSVYRRASDGLWVGAVRVGGRRRTVSAPTKREARERLDDLRASLRQGYIPASTRLTVGRHLDLWLASKRAHVRPSTWESYEGDVRIHLAGIAHIPLPRLVPADVRRLIEDRRAEGCSPRTVAYTLTVLRMALRQAVRDGLIPRNVAALVDPPRTERPKVRVLSPPDARRLMALPSPYAPLWTLLVGTGLRLGEALGLRWTDVYPAGRMLTVSVALRPVPRHARPEAAKWARTGNRLQLVEPKSEAGRRTIALPAFVVHALLEQRARQADLPANIWGLVFTSPRGTPLGARNVARAFHADCAAAGLEPLRLHDLRHAAASLMLAQGASLDDVKRVLGHSTITLTSDTYGHLVEGRSREVADRMERLLG